MKLTGMQNSLLIFQSLLTDEQVASAPVLVLGNKIDKAGAASEDEIRHWLGLHGQTTGKVSLWFYLLMMLCQQCFSGKCPPDNFYKNRCAIPHGF